MPDVGGFLAQADDPLQGWGDPLIFQGTLRRTPGKYIDPYGGLSIAYFSTVL